jgi:hypothetical protein
MPADDWAETFRALPAYTADRLARRGLVGLAGSTIRCFQGGGEGVHMWHNMFVEQIPLAEKVIRTVVVYALLMVLFRLTGKRGLAAMNTFDFIVIFLFVQRRAERRHRQRQLAARRDGRCGDPRRGKRGCQPAHRHEPDSGTPLRGRATMIIDGGRVIDSQLRRLGLRRKRARTRGAAAKR